MKFENMIDDRKVFRLNKDLPVLSNFLYFFLFGDIVNGKF